MAMTIDKRNGDVCFNEEKHVYFHAKDPKKKYISVTTLIHKFEPPFDKEFWSAYKALEQLVEPDYWKLARRDLLAKKKFDAKFLKLYGVEENDFNAVQQNILDNWQKENLASTQRGSSIHANLEHSFYAQKTDISLQKYGLGGRFMCVEGKTELDLENGIYPEYLIYYESPDGKIQLAGQIDLLVKEGNQFSIVDWKGLPLDTKIPTIHGWKTMGDLQVGDKVFDMEGKACSVIHKSEIHNNPCYEIKFTNGDSIIADEDHRWLVGLADDMERTSTVFTTKGVADYMMKYQGRSVAISDSKPLQLPDIKALPMEEEPEVTLGKKEILKNIQAALRASYPQRLKVLRLVAEKFISISKDTKSYVMKDTMFTQDFFELLGTMGIKARTVGTAVQFSSDIEGLFSETVGKLSEYDKPYRIIESITPVPMVQTQCIEVDSRTHTFLCTEKFIVTHNTNKQIKTKSYFDKKTQSSEKLKYPLNTLDNCNYSVYNMQLSTYAWMIEQIHPELKCKELVLVHFDHNNNMTTYKMDYLKDTVEKMLGFWKKEAVLEQHKEARKRIEY